MHQPEGRAAAGNTVIVVEHDMRVVAAGPPRTVAQMQASRTTPYLRAFLQPQPAEDLS